MKTLICLGFILVASSLVLGWKPKKSGSDPKDPKGHKPLFQCETDDDCVKACKDSDDPEGACKRMKTCDKAVINAICNDFMVCKKKEDCKKIGDIATSGEAVLACEEREGHDGKRCYFDGGIIIA